MDGPGAQAPRGGFGFLVRLLVVGLLVLVLGYVGYLAIAIGPAAISSIRPSDWLRGYRRIKEPADVRGAPLRATAGGAERLYVLTTQSERIVPLWLGRRSRLGSRPREMLHVDLWAIDAATATLAWKRRLKSFEDRGDLMHELLGLDGDTLWVYLREPIAVSATDGTLLADGAKLEQVTPALAGKRVDQPGYVAFGGQGLQLTLDDATQWIVAGDTFAAQPRAQAPKSRPGLVPPAYAGSYSSDFQTRGLPIGDRWLGVLTDKEAETLKADPVVPGRDPGERRGVMYDFLKSQHVPQRLTVTPQPYRLWSAKVAKVSAAPPGWSKELPDKWGTRDEFSDYQPLPDAPAFLQAGLLFDGRGEVAVWFREPDSVAVLHHDKIGNHGRLQVSRVAGPGGRVVWVAPLGLANVRSAPYAGTGPLLFFGTEPNPGYQPGSESSPEEFERIVAVDVPSGRVSTFDVTAESLRDEEREPE